MDELFGPRLEDRLAVQVIAQWRRSTKASCASWYSSLTLQYQNQLREERYLTRGEQTHLDLDL